MPWPNMIEFLRIDKFLYIGWIFLLIVKVIILEYLMYKTFTKINCKQ